MRRARRQCLRGAEETGAAGSTWLPGSLSLDPRVAPRFSPRLQPLALCAALTLAAFWARGQDEPAAASPAYTYGNRPIDQLPKSHLAQPETTPDLGEDAGPPEGELRLHLKDAFRVGRSGIERLCVIEARQAAGRHGEAVFRLRGSDGAGLWQERADWLGTNRRLRARWLPVRRGDSATLRLDLGGESRLEVAAPLADQAPSVLGEFATTPDTPLAVDCGLALLPRSHVAHLRGTVLHVDIASAGGFAAPLELRVHRGTDPSPANLLCRAEIAPGALPGRRRLAVPTLGVTGATLDLSVLAASLGETVARQTFVAHLVDRPGDLPFGARPADLRYLLPVQDGAATRSWEELWSASPKRDVVVSFPGRPYRLVLWRGTSYAPCWALPEAWLCYEWLEAEPYFHGAVDCVEPIMDKQCRYSQAEISSSTPARAIVTWRYALTDFEGKVIRDEHAVETWTLYPDGIGTRHLRGVYQDGWHETQEFIIINRPGCPPSSALDPQALTLLNTQGGQQTPHWPKPGLEVEGWSEVIALVNLGAGPRPFLLAPSPPSAIKLWADPYLGKPDIFNSYPHWPVTRGMMTSWLTDPAQFSQPSHSNLANLVDTPVQSRDTEKEWIWLIGMADSPPDALAAAAGWLQPGSVQAGAGVTSQGYSELDRAYHLRHTTGAPTAVFSLTPREGTPIVNPAFVIEGWNGAAQATVPGATEVQTGVEAGRLVLWARGRFDQRLDVRLTE